MMRNNPYSDEPLPINIQTTDRISRLPDLPQKKQIPQTPPLTESIPPSDEEESGEQLAQEPGQFLKFAIGKINDFLQWFAITLAITLAVRFILRLIGADPRNVFADFIYALTSVILFPFLNIVRDLPIHPPNSFFELSTLIGMGIYWLIFWLLRWLVRITITDPKPAE